MDIMLKIHCPSCAKEFIVIDDEAGTDMLNCPHCTTDDDGEDDEEDED